MIFICIFINIIIIIKHIIFIVVWLIYSISQWSKTINLIYRVYKCCFWFFIC